MKLHTSLYVAASVACAAACSRGLPHGSSSGQVFTEAESGGSLSLSAGASFTVRLQATPGTGYDWEVIGGDPAVVAQQGPSTTEPIGPPQPGSAVLVTIPFEARGRGETLLRLAYRRPWEQGAPPARTFALRVSVK
jgi:predicted secreted protein